MSTQQPPTGRALWQEACAFAARMHASQARKDGRTPYFSHPARVAMIVRDVFNCDDPVAIAAAYLHDTIEDTPADYDDLEARFGEQVADVVAALTKNMILPEAQREPDYDRRLGAADWRARLVKLADVIDNSDDLPTRTDGAAPSTLASNINKINRAIALAEQDMETNPTTAAAVKEVRQSLARLTGKT